METDQSHSVIGPLVEKDNRLSDELMVDDAEVKQGGSGNDSEELALEGTLMTLLRAKKGTSGLAASFEIL